MKKLVFCTIAIMLLFSSIVAAEIPRYISIQGRVTNADDSPVASGSYRFLFNVTNNTGKEQWSETQTLYVDKGLFYAELGRNSSGIYLPFEGDYDLFVEVTFNNQKLSPRLNLTSTGHTIWASYLMPYEQYTNIRTSAEMQASIFRDYDNYYNFIDPSSTTYSLNVSGGGRFYGSNTYGLQARRFIDLDSTGYYVDPASTSLMNVVNASIYYDRENSGYYVNPYGISILNQTRTNQTNASQFCIPGASPDCITSWPSGGGGGWATSGSNVYNDTTGVKVGIGTATPVNTLNVVGNINITATTSPALYSKTSGTYAGQFEGKLYSSNDVEAPRFVDSQNTVYYVDPAGTSKINYLEINRGGSGLGHSLTITGDSRYWGWGYWNDTPRIEYAFFNGTAMEWTKMTIGQSSVGIMSYPGDSALEVAGTIDASQMRDRDNTVYYVDPAGTSNINALTWIDSSCNSGNAIRAISSTGGLTCEPVGVGGGGWATSGSYVYNSTTDVRVGIGTNSPTQKLDVNGTINASNLTDRDSSGYSMDPSGTSNLGSVNIASWLQMSGNILMSGNNITNAGYVGIGTTNPSEKLDVNGLIKIPSANANDNDSPGIVFASNDDFLYDGEYLNHYGYGFHTYNDGSSGINAYIASYYGIDFFTAGLERLRINSNGRVGIGTTNPQSKLEVKDQIRIARSNDDYGYVFKTESTGNYLYIGYMTSADTWYPSEPRITLDANTGNVGIGTITPGYKLDVNGSANAQQLCIAGVCQSSWPSGGGGGWATSGSNVYNDTTGVKVGIGTATPVNTLNVVGNINITATTSPALYSKTSGTYAGQFEGKLYSSNDVEAPRFVDSQNTVYYVDPAGTSNINALTWIDGSCNSGNAIRAISSTGGLTCEPVGVGGGGWAVSGSYVYNNTAGVNVGIGTATPTYKLDVNGLTTGTARFIGGSAGNPTIILQEPVANTEANLMFYNSSGYPVWSFSKQSDSDMSLWQNIAGTWYNRMWWQNDGNVGIGTNSPAYKLDVSGNIRTTGTLYANANGAAYLCGGDDACLYDVNIENTVGIYGVQNPAVATIRLGSGGADISGSGGNVGIGMTGPGYKLDVAGSANAQQLCIAGTCKSSWPSGGTVTSISAGNGLTASPSDPIITSGTLNVVGGAGITVNANNIEIRDCAANQILKRDAGDTDWVCAADSGITACSSCDSTFVNVGGDTMTGALIVEGTLKQGAGVSQASLVKAITQTKSNSGTTSGFSSNTWQTIATLDCGSGWVVVGANCRLYGGNPYDQPNDDDEASCSFVSTTQVNIRCTEHSCGGSDGCECGVYGEVFCLALT